MEQHLHACCILLLCAASAAILAELPVSGLRSNLLGCGASMKHPKQTSAARSCPTICSHEMKTDRALGVCYLQQRGQINLLSPGILAFETQRLQVHTQLQVPRSLTLLQPNGPHRCTPYYSTFDSCDTLITCLIRCSFGADGHGPHTRLTSQPGLQTQALQASGAHIATVQLAYCITHYRSKPVCSSAAGLYHLYREVFSSASAGT